MIHYAADIQPIFNAKCVSCHGNADPAGGLKLTDDVTVYYNTSYEELAQKQLAGPIISEFTTFRRGDQGNYNGATLAPGNLGSHKSVLIDMLTNPDHPKNAQDDHSEMLDKMELMVLGRWVDCNYQFYGSYYGRHHSAWVNADPQKPSYKPADFRRKPLFEEAISMRAPQWHQ
ncbi:MAG: hypothetical protein ACYSWQ_04565 [Planctomycetota bacterium]